MIVACLAALLAGVTRTIARMANAELGRRIGPFQSTWYTYMLGLFCSALALLLIPGSLPVFVPSDIHVPGWAYLGGVVGVFFVILSNLATPKMTAFSMTLLIFVGQIAAGIVIDIAVNQSVSPGKVVGGLLILLGLLGNLMIDEDGKPVRRTDSDVP